MAELPERLREVAGAHRPDRERMLARVEHAMTVSARGAAMSGADRSAAPWMRVAAVTAAAAGAIGIGGLAVGAASNDGGSGRTPGRGVVTSAATEAGTEATASQPPAAAPTTAPAGGHQDGRRADAVGSASRPSGAPTSPPASPAASAAPPVSPPAAGTTGPPTPGGCTGPTGGLPPALPPTPPQIPVPTPPPTPPPRPPQVPAPVPPRIPIPPPSSSGSDSGAASTASRTQTDSSGRTTRSSIALTIGRPLTSLTVELRVVRTAKVAGTGSSSSDAAQTSVTMAEEGGFLVYRWTLDPGQTLRPGTYTFTGLFAHAAGRDTRSDAYTVMGSGAGGPVGATGRF